MKIKISLMCILLFYSGGKTILKGEFVNYFEIFYMLILKNILAFSVGLPCDFKSHANT